MKNKIFCYTTLAMAAVLLLSGCGGVGNAPSSGAQSDSADFGSETSVSFSEASAGSSGDASWEIGEIFSREWANDSGAKWIQYSIPIANTGNDDLFLSNATILLNGAGGQTVATHQYGLFCPQIIAPGETSRLCVLRMLTEAGDVVSLVPLVSAVKSPYSLVRFDVSVDCLSVDLPIQNYLMVNASGTVKNSTGTTFSSTIHVMILLFDEAGNNIGWLINDFEGLQAGESKEFSANNNLYYSGASEGTIARYEVYAFPDAEMNAG